ncbi:eukaryotic translation initiation factor 2-alpha kinase [Rhizoctonia solani]|uniref:non-specific serine/threonine protein kinase n=1 Tax=Rhizoctonia solani TaxID=456999 RepID=A0A0K6G909_9AGAM|nr:eukaryotic translation initiation factor 2-alpha kinase [Rhizoctonia solani]
MATATDLKNLLADQLSELESITEVFGPENVQRLETKQAWGKNAPQFIEFDIRITPSDIAPDAEPVHVTLHVKFPHTYPRVPAQFTVKDPVNFPKRHIPGLNKFLRAAAERYINDMMVLVVADELREQLSILTSNGAAPAYTSLADQATHRTNAALAAQKAEREAQAAKEVAVQIEEAREIEEGIKAMELRRRTQFGTSPADRGIILGETKSQLGSEKAMHHPEPNNGAGIEQFDENIELGGRVFNAVRVSCPQPVGAIGTVYFAEPVFQEADKWPLKLTMDTQTEPEVPMLEMHETIFYSKYYSNPAGRSKLATLITEIRRLIAIKHPNLQEIYAVKLTTTEPRQSGLAFTPVSPWAGADFTHGDPRHLTSGAQISAYTRLCILVERSPQLMLDDVLAQCENLKKDRAINCICSALQALSVLHNKQFTHRAINLSHIGFTQGPRGHPGTLKVRRSWWFARLIDLHKGNPYGRDTKGCNEDQTPERWILPEVLEEPHQYSYRRDIWALGIVFIQVLMSPRVIYEFGDIHEALSASDVPERLQEIVLAMVTPQKKRPTCLSILSKLGSLGQVTPVPNSRSAPRVSRFREEWEELEFLGKGGFGSVVKARNKLDGRIYAVKKIRLRGADDAKIYREITALSKLSNRFIVRYYTAWLETLQSGANSPTDSDGSTASSDTSEEAQTVTNDSTDAAILFNLDDLPPPGSSPYTGTSFPGIHFRENSQSQSRSSLGFDDSSDEDEDDAPIPTPSAQAKTVTPKANPRILYIQMEFVENQTLKEMVERKAPEGGFSEEESWRLFRQLIEALVHLQQNGILHRDIKLSNIFIDAKGDAKLGDFGLAVNAVVPEDPSDLVISRLDAFQEMTSGVGTSLYVAPEVMSRRRKGSRNQSKADLYSLGIVFFELNFPFVTGSERVSVLTELRHQSIRFPSAWPEARHRQRKIIEMLLEHDPDKRPSALQLSRSEYLPETLEDEYVKEALPMIVDPKRPHYEALLAKLFDQDPIPAKAFIYNMHAEIPDHAALYDTVRDKIVSVFHIQGAVSKEPILLAPNHNSNITSGSNEERQSVILLDRRGDLVTLPRHATTPFARLAAVEGTTRIKRYSISNAYRPTPVGPPKAIKFAIFDIITPDTDMDSIGAAEAECIRVADEVLSIFPGTREQQIELHLTHDGLTRDIRKTLADIDPQAEEILSQPRSSFPQKRAHLSRLGVPRSVVDVIEILTSTYDEVAPLFSRLDKVSLEDSPGITYALEEIKRTLTLAHLMGVRRKIVITPWSPSMLSQADFTGGLVFEARGAKRTDIYARGGRYDPLITKFTVPNRRTPIRAVAVQISMDKIASALADYLSSSVKSMVKEERSFGYWSPSRCDVYIASFQLGLLHERVELLRDLWSHRIRTDTMYEEATQQSGEEHVRMCKREGTLFLVYVRLKARRDSNTLLVKNVLTGVETEVARNDLVPWLEHHLAEQRRAEAIEGTTPASGTEPTLREAHHNSIHVLVPGEGHRKQRKQSKNIFLEKAQELQNAVRETTSTGIQILAVDVPAPAFNAMTAGTSWLSDDDMWKTTVLNAFPKEQTAHAVHIREEIVAKRAQGHKLLLLLSVRDDRTFLFTLR